MWLAESFCPSEFDVFSQFLSLFSFLRGGGGRRKHLFSCFFYFYFFPSLNRSFYFFSFWFVVWNSSTGEESTGLDGTLDCPDSSSFSRLRDRGKSSDCNLSYIYTFPVSIVVFCC